MTGLMIKSQIGEITTREISSSYPSYESSIRRSAPLHSVKNMVAEVTLHYNITMSKNCPKFIKNFPKYMANTMHCHHYGGRTDNGKSQHEFLEKQ